MLPTQLQLIKFSFADGDIYPKDFFAHCLISCLGSKHQMYQIPRDVAIGPRLFPQKKSKGYTQ
jgi:hypothetical protein